MPNCNSNNFMGACWATQGPLTRPHKPSCLSFSGWVLPPASEATMPSISRWAAELNPTGPSRCGSLGSFTSSAVDRRILCASQRWDTCSCCFHLALKISISIITTARMTTCNMKGVAHVDDPTDNYPLSFTEFYNFFQLIILVFQPATSALS